MSVSPRACRNITFDLMLLCRYMLTVNQGTKQLRISRLALFSILFLIGLGVIADQETKKITATIVAIFIQSLFVIYIFGDLRYKKFKNAILNPQTKAQAIYKKSSIWLLFFLITMIGVI